MASVRETSPWESLGMRNQQSLVMYPKQVSARTHNLLRELCG